MGIIRDATAKERKDTRLDIVDNLIESTCQVGSLRNCWRYANGCLTMNTEERAVQGDGGPDPRGERAARPGRTDCRAATDDARAGRS